MSVDDEDDRLVRSIVDRLRAEREWLRAARETTDVGTEGVIATWLTEIDEPERPNLRARFEHKLAGVDARTLNRVALLVRAACAALRANDVELLEAIATKADELAGRATEHGRAAHALDVCARGIDAARRGAFDDVAAERTAYELVQAYPEVSRAGIAKELQQQIIAIASVPASRTGNPGRGHKEARNLVVWALTSADACSESVAHERVKAARKEARRKTKRGRTAP
jgi:hypothetical protein